MGCVARGLSHLSSLKLPVLLRRQLYTLRASSRSLSCCCRYFIQVHRDMRPVRKPAPAETDSNISSPNSEPPALASPEHSSALSPSTQQQQQQGRGGRKKTVISRIIGKRKDRRRAVKADGGDDDVRESEAVRESQGDDGDVVFIGGKARAVKPGKKSKWWSPKKSSKLGGGKLKKEQSPASEDLRDRYPPALQRHVIL